MNRWLQTRLCLEHRDNLKRKPAKAASEVAQAEPGFDEKRAFGGKTQNKAERTKGAKSLRLCLSPKKRSVTPYFAKNRVRRG